LEAWPAGGSGSTGVDEGGSRRRRLGSRVRDGCMHVVASRQVGVVVTTSDNRQQTTPRARPLAL
jgi:hypothetical protein